MNKGLQMKTIYTLILMMLATVAQGEDILSNVSDVKEATLVVQRLPAGDKWDKKRVVVLINDSATGTILEPNKYGLYKLPPGVYKVVIDTHVDDCKWRCVKPYTVSVELGTTVKTIT
jgi:hypothetical protein